MCKVNQFVYPVGLCHEGAKGMEIKLLRRPSMLKLLLSLNKKNWTSISLVTPLSVVKQNLSHYPALSSFLHSLMPTEPKRFGEKYKIPLYQFSVIKHGAIVIHCWLW